MQYRSVAYHPLPAQPAFNGLGETAFEKMWLNAGYAPPVHAAAPVASSFVVSSPLAIAAEGVMQVWKSRRDTTRMYAAMGDLAEKFGAQSPQMVAANDALKASLAKLRPEIDKVMQAEILANSSPPSLPSPLPAMPARWINDGFPESDWVRALRVAKTMDNPSRSQLLFNWLSEENKFWSIVKQVNNVVSTAGTIARGGLSLFESPWKIALLGAGVLVVAIFVLKGRR